MTDKRVIISIYDDVHNPHYGGGGAIVVHEVAKRLADDYAVTVVSGSYRGSRNHTRDSVRYVYLPVGWAGPRLGQLAFHALLPLAARFANYDLWIESFTPPFSTSFLPRFTRRPVLGLVQMLCAEDMSRKYLLPFSVIERRGLAVYRHFVVLNPADQETICRHNASASCAVIPNGVDVPDEPSRAGSGSFILFLGRVDVAQKGLDLLVSAYVDSGIRLPLILAGSGTGTELKRLSALLARTGCNRIKHVGHVSGSEKEALLRDCAFLVMPSRYETFGLSALEAMSHAKPVLHFDLPQLQWIGREGAVAVPPFDVDGLSQALRRLSDDESCRATLGQAARAAAIERSWNVVGERYRQLVRDLVETTPRHGSLRSRLHPRTVLGNFVGAPQRFRGGPG